MCFSRAQLPILSTSSSQSPGAHHLHESNLGRQIQALWHFRLLFLLFCLFCFAERPWRGGSLMGGSCPHTPTFPVGVDFGYESLSKSKICRFSHFLEKQKEKNVFLTKTNKSPEAMPVGLGGGFFGKNPSLVVVLVGIWSCIVEFLMLGEVRWFQNLSQ